MSVSNIRNIEVRQAIAPLFDCTPEDIVGYVVFSLTSDRQYQILSNGNEAQIQAAMDDFLRRLGIPPDEMGSESPNGNSAGS